MKSLARIRRLYFETTPKTVQRDLTEAVTLFKSLPDEESRATADRPAARRVASGR